ncbi:N-alpha-acetyltransferase 25, NatB auxiliary subunit [Neodiprion fabricii]|uniref:N-alpha-acetyltransferase 25, NatB auxiliary subunit n=1 Tax=Neodiprion fabricii TaxID=2872261 RepID=UPI001ED902B6|nr:N-alpha-acetyltransferase 25, NatB auxiliary subunit [Neodiprion fabricii]
MASKAHVDNTVNERRLRPIYDWLDHGNNKKALQEAEKVLKKQPSNQCARVLKALALLRLGKEDNCQMIMEEVRAEVPCDDSTLQAMSICYREIHKPDKISELYEAAVKADPTNEELLTHLFMSYVRLCDFKKQQQTAVALYKLKPKNPYYFWAVMSVVMQAMQADERLAKAVVLPLAERMVLKMVNEGRIEAEQEVHLYLMVLELQGKEEAIMEVLTGPLAFRLSSLPQRRATLMLQLHRYSEAASTFKELMHEDIDNWTYYRDYLAAALKSETPQKCLDLLNEIIATKGEKARAPRLARFELLKHARLLKIELNSLDSTQLMHQYFTQFGEKGCVVGDLKLYLHLLKPDERLHLIKKLEQDVAVGADDYPTTIGQMQRHIHLEQLRRICGLHHSPTTSIEERISLADRLCDLHKKGNALCPASDRLPTDFCPADAYGLLATHLFHQLWVETQEALYLYRAMALLEQSLVSSPSNFHTKILLVRIYLEAGLVGAANHIFALLDVKHIQLDSLGHLHAPLLAPLGHLSQASSTLDHAAKFFVTNYKDSADHLTFAYKYGSFVKIQEFVELRKRLDNSLHFAMTTVDKMLLELSWCDSPNILSVMLTSMRIQPHEDSIRWNLIRDNRDLEVVVGWEPLDSYEKDPRFREETVSCMLVLLSARNLLLRIVAAAAETESSPLLAQLGTELEKLQQERIPEVLGHLQDRGSSAQSILVPLDAIERLKEAHESEQLKIIARLAKCLSRSSSPDSQCLQDLDATPGLRTLPIPCQQTPASYKRFLMRAVTCGETLALIGAVCCGYTTSQTPSSNKKNNKKSGKKIKSPQPDQLTDGWKDIGNLLVERASVLDSVLSMLEKVQLQTGLDSEEAVTATVVQRSQESIAQSSREIKSRVQLTIKLLNSLNS